MFSRFFIDRPIFATVLSVLITLLGAIALGRLPLAQYPQIVPPTINVTCAYPGASADVVAETVGAPIEQQVNGVEDMLYMSSQSTNDGGYNLTVTFKPGVDLNFAQVLVQNRVSLALPSLPDVVKAIGVTTRKRSPDILLIVSMVSVDPEKYDQLYVSNYGTINVVEELARVEGVGDVRIFGALDYAMRVWVDPERLAARNMSASDVVQALREQNVQVAAGQLGQQPVGGPQEFQMPFTTLGRLGDPQQFADIVLKATPDGRTVRVKDVGRVELGAKNNDISARLDGMPCANVACFGLPEANALDTADRIRARMAELKKNFPEGVDYRIVFDTTPFVRESVNEVFRTLLDAVLLVALVVLVFLQTWRSTIIPLVAVPVAVIGTFAAMGLLGFSLNNLTLFGLVLAIGIVVDDAIVVVEAVEHHIEQGMLPREATFKAMDEVSGPVIAVGLVLTAVFVPCAFITGITGAFFRQFALTIAVSTLISAFNSLTLSPALCAILLQPRDAGRGKGTQAPYGLALAAGLALAWLLPARLLDWTGPHVASVTDSLEPVAVLWAVRLTLGLAGFGLVLLTARLLRPLLARQHWPGLVAEHAVALATAVALAWLLPPHPIAWLALADPWVAPQLSENGALVTMWDQWPDLWWLREGIGYGLAGLLGLWQGLLWLGTGEMWVLRGLLFAGGYLLGWRAGRDVVQFHTRGEQRPVLPPHGLALAAGVALAWLFAPGLPERLGETGAWLNHWLGDAGTLWAARGALFVAGYLLGWLASPPVNGLLSLAFWLFNSGFRTATSAYTRLVGLALRGSLLVLLLYGGMLLLTWWGFRSLPLGYIPGQDRGYLFASVQLPESSSLERTREVVDRIDAICKQTPGVAHTVSIAGQSFVLQAFGSNFGQMFIILDEFEHRRSPALYGDAVANALRKRIGMEIPDAMVSVMNPAPVSGLGISGGYKFIVEDRGDLGVRVLQDQTNNLIKQANQTPGLANVFTIFRADSPLLQVDVDRKQCATLGVELRDVFNTLQVYLGSMYVNDFNKFGRTWQVVVQAEGEFRNQVEDVRRLRVRNKEGKMVPVGTLATVREREGPLLLTRYNMYPGAVVNGAAAPGVSSGQAIALVQQLAQQHLPPTMAVEWTEISLLQLQSGNTALLIFALAVVGVFLVLAALYESWALPLAVILVVPLCLLGSLSGVAVKGSDVNVFTQIGIVVLVGLASKNAILIVEFAKLKREQGLSRRLATLEACHLRLRPILMTSFAFILGVLPLVLATGAGAEMRQALGTAVFSGMLGVTLFGIFLTPVFYYVINWASEAPVFTSPHLRRAGLALVALIGLATLALGGALLYLTWRRELLPWWAIVALAAGLLAAVAYVGLRQVQKAGRWRLPKRLRDTWRFSRRGQPAVPTPHANGAINGTNGTAHAADYGAHATPELVNGKREGRNHSGREDTEKT